MTTNFTITNLPDNRLVTEGGSLSLSLTPAGGFTGKIVWQVLFNGKRPATAGDFDVLTGTLDFADGTDQAVILSFVANFARLGERSFQLQFYHEADDGTLTPEGEGHHFTLQDSDTDEAVLPRTRAAISGGGDIIALGSHYDYEGNINAGGGDDLFIITRHQTQNLTISDLGGNNIVKFDHDVVITGIQEFGPPTFVVNVNITLGTGAVISIGTPNGDSSEGGKQYQYQLGDGLVMDYTDFIAALGTPTIADPFAVAPVSDSPVADQPAEVPLPRTRAAISGGGDVVLLGSHYDYEGNINAGGGDDLFIITRHQTQNLTISDLGGNNIVKFDHDVVITGIQEFGPPTFVVNVNITLGTGAVISIGTPNGDSSEGGKQYQYQLGDGIVMDYVDFIAALGTPTTTDPFTVTRPSEEVGDPLFTFDEYLTYDGSFKAFNVSEFGNDPAPTSTTPDLSVANLLYLDEASVLPRSNGEETANLNEGDDIYLVTSSFFESKADESELKLIDLKGDNIIVLGKGLEIVGDPIIYPHKDLFSGNDLAPEVSLKLIRSGDSSTEYLVTVLDPDNYTVYHEGAGNDSLFELTDYTMVELV